MKISLPLVYQKINDYTPTTNGQRSAKKSLDEQGNLNFLPINKSFTIGFFLLYAPANHSKTFIFMAHLSPRMARLGGFPGT
jgi:hypothetical protein